MILKDKSLLKSWTFWGAMGVAVIEAAEKLGLLAPGFAQTVASVVQSLSGVLAVIGLRRALPGPQQ